MRYVCTTPPTSAAVALADVRQFCRIDGHDDDALLVRLVDRATRELERALSRQFVTATWKLYLSHFPAEIELRILPVASVTSITYVDTSGTTQTLAADQYQTNLVGLDTPGRIKPAYGLTWPSTRSDTYNSVTVTFTAGYGAATAVPESVKQAIQLLVAHGYENREPINIGNLVTPIDITLQWLMSLEGWGDYS